MLTSKGILCRKSDTVSCPVEIIWSGVCCSRMFLALLLGINGKAMKLIVSLKIGNFITIALRVGFFCQLDEEWIALPSLVGTFKLDQPSIRLWWKLWRCFLLV